VALDVSALDPTERDVLARCGAGDSGLESAARAVASRKVAGQPIPDIEAMSALQRAAGEPHPWARAWVARAPRIDEDVLARVAAWLGAAREGQRRCGVATETTPEGDRVLAVVTVDALADLAPLPTRVRPGEWLALDVCLRVPASGAAVLLLGPSGAPRRVPSSLEAGWVRAHFAADRPGEFLLQVTADVAGGTRPVVEASLFAGMEPAVHVEPSPAPGEALAGAQGTDEDTLARMIDAARGAEGLPALRRDATLQAVARQHAARMAAARQLAHDAGDGGPYERLAAAGIAARYVGENVAHARSLALAHRAVWVSPAHRTNLLLREFSRLGVGVARDEGGELWIVEAFASGQ
jgi:uncharacterized protein YkwD